MIFALKMLGIMAVLSGVMIIIYLKIKEKKKSLIFLTDFISCIKYIEDLISVSAIPFEEVLVKTRETAKESRIFFENVGNFLKNEDNPTLFDVWTECAEFLKNEGLKPETVSVIKRIGSHLGTMSISIEAENLKLARGELLKIKERIEQECAKECKLIKSLGAAICGFIILIFI